jgi:hypothetical protein
MRVRNSGSNMPSFKNAKSIRFNLNTGRRILPSSRMSFFKTNTGNEFIDITVVEKKCKLK